LTIAATISACSELLAHPLEELRRQWVWLAKTVKQSFGDSGFREDNITFICSIANEGVCWDIFNSKRPIDCHCMANVHLTKEEADKTTGVLSY
jgi:hypothetical protein